MTKNRNDPNEIRKILEEYGFKVIDIKEVTVLKYSVKKKGKEYYFIKTQIHPSVVRALGLEGKKLKLIICYDE